MGVPAGPKLDFVGASEVCAQTTMLLIFVVARHIFVTQYKSISNDLRWRKQKGIIDLQQLFEDTPFQLDSIRGDNSFFIYDVWWKRNDTS